MHDIAALVPPNLHELHSAYFAHLCGDQFYSLVFAQDIWIYDEILYLVSQDDVKY